MHGERWLTHSTACLDLLLSFSLSLSDDSLQSSRIAHTHDLLGLDFAQFLPLTQRIGLFSMKKADIQVCSISELLHHTAGMVHQLKELFKRRQSISQAVQQADRDVKNTTQQLETMKKRVAMGDKVSTRQREREDREAIDMCI